MHKIFSLSNEHIYNFVLVMNVLEDNLTLADTQRTPGQKRNVCFAQMQSFACSL